MRDRLVLVDISIKKFKSISYKQYDTNNLLQIVVMENKSIVNISNYIATAYFEMPSGNIYKINGTINNNTINISLSEQVLSEYGQVMAEIELVNYNKIVTTFTFYLNIEKSIDKARISANTNHTHLNKNILDSITESNIQEWNNKSNFDGDYNSLTNKPTIPTKTSQLQNDKGYAVQPNFSFQINMIASTEQPSVTTTGTYPNLVITFNIPQGTSSGGSDEPIVDEKAIYYGRLSISEVGGRVIQYGEITDTMILNGANITKITPQALGKTSVGKQSTTAEGDYVVVAVPKNEGYVVTQDNGIGGKAIFNKEDAGANGDVTLVIDGNEYVLYGQILISPAEIFIYIDKN